MNIIYYLWDILFPKPTVGSVMSTFTTTIRELGEVAERNEVAAENLAEQRRSIDDQITVVNFESQQARKIGAKLSAIVEA